MGSEHLLGFLTKITSAAQLHHPSTYGTKITGIQNFGPGVHYTEPSDSTPYALGMHLFMSAWVALLVRSLILEGLAYHCCGRCAVSNVQCRTL